MSKVDTHRAVALQFIADHLLAYGLADTGLRALAQAASTSDRMLVYYFETKDQLVEQALVRNASNLMRILDEAALAPQAWEPAADALWRVLTTRKCEPYVRLWIEISGYAARGREPFARVAGLLADGFYAWALAHVVAPPRLQKADAARMLVQVEGRALLHAIGRGAIAKRAAER